MDFMNSKSNNPSQYKNLMVVDFLNLCFRYKHAKKKVFAADVINTIQSLGNSYEAKDIVIAGDWGSAWRKSIYPEYKANREELRERQTEEEKRDFEEFLEEANRAFEMLRDMYIAFKFKGVEADDIAAFIVKSYNGRYEHIWLISSDKDWDLLIKKNVSRFSYVTRKEITFENWSNHYEYEIDQHISIKVIQGDTGDNVIGVAGIGPKRAMAILRDYESAYDVYAALPLPGKHKYIQNLNEFGDKILLNYDLMDIETNCEVAIGKENYNIIMEEME